MNIYWVALAAAICTSLGGQVLLKAGAVAEGHFITQLFRPTTVIGLAAYGGAALLYIVALRQDPDERGAALHRRQLCRGGADRPLHVRREPWAPRSWPPSA